MKAPPFKPLWVKPECHRLARELAAREDLKIWEWIEQMAKKEAEKKEKRIDNYRFF